MKKVLSFILALTLLISAANVFALPVFGEEMVKDENATAEESASNDVNARAEAMLLTVGILTKMVQSGRQQTFYGRLMIRVHLLLVEKEIWVYS